MNTEEILTQRNSTHGSFADNARVSQDMKRLLHPNPHWATLTDVQREAIDMICLKLSRIMSGQGGFQDHWDDISGYAKLASKEISIDKSWADAAAHDAEAAK